MLVPLDRGCKVGGSPTIFVAIFMETVGVIIVLFDGQIVARCVCSDGAALQRVLSDFLARC